MELRLFRNICTYSIGGVDRKQTDAYTKWLKIFQYHHHAIVSLAIQMLCAK